MKYLCKNCGQEIHSSIFHVWGEKCHNCDSEEVIPIREGKMWEGSQAGVKA